LGPRASNLYGARGVWIQFTEETDMVIRPSDVKKEPLTDEDLELLAKIEEQMDERLLKNGRVVDFDMYDVLNDEGRPLPHRVWDALLEKYDEAGWSVSRRGRMITITK